VAGAEAPAILFFDPAYRRLSLIVDKQPISSIGYKLRHTDNAAYLNRRGRYLLDFRGLPAFFHADAQLSRF
jgi:hypothetical protein